MSGQITAKKNAMRCSQAGPVRYQPGDRLWLAALSRLIPHRPWDEVFARPRRRCPPGTGDWSHRHQTGGRGVELVFGVIYQPQVALAGFGNVAGMPCGAWPPRCSPTTAPGSRR
jgi:hypothetical protein